MIESLDNPPLIEEEELKIEDITPHIARRKVRVNKFDRGPFRTTEDL